MGVAGFIALAAACSTSVGLIPWRMVAWGLGLQLTLAFVILKFEVGGVRPGYELFSAIARAAQRFMAFTDAGSRFVFGELANPEVVSQLFPGGFVFAFAALPIIIFISSFFTVLYHFGILQFFVKQTARAVVALLNTSGAETLSAVANVFMGQDRSPDHRPAVRLPHDPLGVADIDGRRHGDDLRRRDGDLHQPGRRCGCHPDDQRHGSAVRPLRREDPDAGNGGAEDPRHGDAEGRA